MPGQPPPGQEQGREGLPPVEEMMLDDEMEQGRPSPGSGNQGALGPRKLLEKALRMKYGHNGNGSYQGNGAIHHP